MFIINDAHEIYLNVCIFVFKFLFECQIDVHAKLEQFVYLVSLIFNLYFIFYDFSSGLVLQ